jgi:chemotaxis protein methyltransferase CheR
MSRRVPSTEVRLSDELYVRFRDLLRTRCGLFYPEHRRNDLEHRLQMALNTTAHPDLAALYDDAIGGGAAWEAILAQLTIGETYFFRNRAQFDALRHYILPEVMARRASIQSLRMWSAGCATGEEPYSLAMTIAELLTGRDPWHLTILATDINPTFLTRAREGVYGEWSFRGTPAALHTRFFHPEERRWRIDPTIRQMVSFARLNLVEPCYPSVTTGTCAFDIIICRNVTIYFDAATTRQIVERLFEALAPGGWLIVGHAEPHASIYHQFEVHNFPDTIIYRKPLSAPLFIPALQSFRIASKTVPVPSHSRASRTVSNEPLASSTPMPEQQADLNAAPEAESERTSSGEATTVVDLLGVGRQCANQGEWAAAEAHCTRALTQDPLCIDAHHLLAQIHEHQGRLDAALAAYRRTVYLDRGFVLGMIGMGNVWRQLGHVTNARRSYRNALQHLERLPIYTAIPGADGDTRGALVALVTQYIQLLM